MKKAKQPKIKYQFYIVRVRTRRAKYFQVFAFGTKKDANGFAKAAEKGGCEVQQGKCLGPA